MLMLFISLAVSPPEAEAQSRNGGDFGIGIMVGEPTGITPKLWLSNNNALAAGVAWSYRGSSGSRSRMHLHLDYQIHNFDLINVERGTMSFYYGFGGRFLIRDDRYHRHHDNHRRYDDRFGIRVPLGLNYLFANDPIELFMEVAPILDLVPSTYFSVNGAIGIRYYF